MRCTHCNLEINEFVTNVVYSAGDYDPYCDSACQDAASRRLDREMTQVHAMTDAQFSQWLNPHGGNACIPKPEKPEPDTKVNWKKDGF
jgi:hypothetical protein